MGSNRSWDGKFDSSLEANRSIEDLILDVMDGNEIGKATDDGGLIKVNRDGSYDIFGPSNGPKGHYHLNKDKDGNYHGHG